MTASAMLRKARNKYITHTACMLQRFIHETNCLLGLQPMQPHAHPKKQEQRKSSIYYSIFNSHVQ